MIQSLLGLFVLSAFAWLLSEQRRAVSWRVVVVGLAMQIVLALLLLKLPLFKEVFLVLNRALLSLQTATEAGASFVFGYLGGGDLPFDEKSPGSSFILAFKALPLVLVISALSAVLFYWRILPLVVRGFSWVLEKTLGVGGALGLGAAANIFV
ncbi:MAG: nucleoside:proton symporter, partial [Gammaproteobacteria bacterium]|nr:nucleoside:proton symporter [Gammaproteobacteria bacterium]